jgi:hypothetical protein
LFTSPPCGCHMDSLKLSVLTPHHATEGCKCKECFGLTEFMRDLTGRDYGLPPTEAPLRAVPLPLSPVERCDGSFTCDCSSCAQERSERVRRPPKAAKQPWELAA